MPAKKPLSGMSFVITGTLSENRDTVIKNIKKRGGTVKSSVSGSIDYVISGSKPGSTKYDAAVDKGIKIISESGLNTLIAGGTPRSLSKPQTSKNSDTAKTTNTSKPISKKKETTPKSTKTTPRKNSKDTRVTKTGEILTQKYIYDKEYEENIEMGFGPDDKVRLYHGTFMDFDKFNNTVYATRDLNSARHYANGLEAAVGEYIGEGKKKIIHPSEQRIVTMDIPLNLFGSITEEIHTEESDKQWPYYSQSGNATVDDRGWQIIIHPDIANQYVGDDGRDSILYGSKECYHDITMLPKEDCHDPNNKIFNDPDKLIEPSDGSEYGINTHWEVMAAGRDSVVHSFDSYYYDEDNKIVHYKFEDGNVLSAYSKDPTKYGFIIQGENIINPLIAESNYNDIKLNKPMKSDWISYKKALQADDNYSSTVKRGRKPQPPVPELPTEIKTVKKRKSPKIPAPKLPGGRKPKVATRRKRK